LIGGLIHLQLYFDGYRDIPNANLGRSFLLNGFGSAVIAIALLARRDIIVRLAGIGLVAGTLIAFTLTRNGHPVFGFTEKGFEPSPQAALTLIVEIIAMVALLVSLVPAIGGGRSMSMKALAPLAAAVVIVTIVMSVLWNRSPDVTASPATPAAPGGTAAPGDTAARGAAAPSAVTIAQFAFGPPTLTVAAGTTVTWTNTDGVTHTVDSTDKSFKSDDLESGATFTHEFDTAGTFSYICDIHPSMKGTVTVTG
ncbi:MAG: copper binding protein plastocyanin/azurin family protein, partial [Ilumatobacteraceae bacterium]|nr:copper binding protein plastocyanin/azurin family protein [Ilumatobacteraceae bacterium]